MFPNLKNLSKRLFKNSTLCTICSREQNQPRRLLEGSRRSLETKPSSSSSIKVSLTYLRIEGWMGDLSIGDLLNISHLVTCFQDKSMSNLYPVYQP
jgi:hypothetical protein